MNRSVRLIIGMLVLCSAGCGGKTEKPFQKPTIPVKGKITINGAAPTQSVQVEVRSTQIADEHVTASTAQTDADGNFAFTTYQPGDGVPYGRYVLMAKSQKLNMLSRDFEGPDLLKGKYDAMNEAAANFEVKEGDKPLDLGTIDLKTTGAPAKK